MEPSRNKDPKLAEKVDAGHLAWHRQITPITEYYAQIIARRDYRGKRLAYWGHVTGQNLITLTQYKGSDPEVNTRGGNANLAGGEDYTAFPAYKILTFGLQLNF